MLDSKLEWLSRRGNADRARRGLRGVEKESLRVDARGRLAKTAHPAALGSPLTHPYLTTDYSEALLEFVTPPYPSNWQTLQFLCDLHSFVHRRLGEELMWPASMPCVINANQEIPIAAYGTSNAGQMRTIYRRGLGFRYGRAMQAIAGAHFNFSLPEEFWEPYRDHCGVKLPPRAFKSEQMMGLVRNYRRSAWLVVYLFGASPAFCKSFRPERHALMEELDSATWYGPYATSLRMSDIGYRNSTQARLSISANSLEEYIGGLTAAVTTPDPHYAEIGVIVDGEFRQLNANVLQIENEYYSSVRPKPKDRTIRAIAGLKRDGVEYVEIRTLDLNAADPVGINQAQMRFLETLLVYCLLADSPALSPAEQLEIDARDVQVAREGRRPDLKLVIQGKSVASLRAAALPLLERLEPIAALLDGDARDYATAVEAARAAVEDPSLTPSAKLLAELSGTGTSFFEYVHALARRHRDYFLALPLDPAKEAMLDRTAAASHLETHALESKLDVPFVEYLKRYSDTL